MNVKPSEAILRAELIGTVAQSRSGPLVAPVLSNMSVPISREQLLVTLFFLSFVNGTLIRILLEAHQVGWLPAATNTFGISVLVWAALWLGARLLLQRPTIPIQSPDRLFAAVVVVLTIIPIATFSWLAMTGLAIYVIHSSNKGTPQYRGAWILLALTVPMFWSKEVFATLSEYILTLEAVLIGTAMGSPQVGNMVQFADGSGYMEIWPACSSFANVSLAVLCWVIFSQMRCYTGSRLQRVGWCLLACVIVLIINVARISLIGFFPHYYDLLHGPIGTSVAGWLTLATSVAICAVATRPTTDPAAAVQVAHA